MSDPRVELVERLWNDERAREAMLREIHRVLGVTAPKHVLDARRLRRVRDVLAGVLLGAVIAVLAVMGLS